MPTISTLTLSIIPPPSLSNPRLFPPASPPILRFFPPCPHLYLSISNSRKTLSHSKSSEEDDVLSEPEDGCLQKLPEKKKALYSHSLPCVEAWLRSLGFYQSRDDRAVWFVEKPGWHAQLSLDVTDLYIRFAFTWIFCGSSEYQNHFLFLYLKSGAGNLEKDVERRFSYALSREDIENAILGGP
ncbi:hypothetical protein OROMI_027380 [Orobanche minor]